MNTVNLEDLVRIGQLHEEPPNKREFDGLVNAAAERFADAQLETLSYASRFDLAYNAAHGLALAALRVAGYRTDKRYLVFQCLIHTAGLNKAQTRIFTTCHERRNKAEYEGIFEIDEPLLTELITSTDNLLKQIRDTEL
jgi:hypothetical protein